MYAGFITNVNCRSNNINQHAINTLESMKDEANIATTSLIKPKIKDFHVVDINIRISINIIRESTPNCSIVDCWTRSVVRKLYNEERSRDQHSSVVRPAMLYGLETVAVTKKQVEEMEVAEMKMLRFTMGVTRKDKIRNEHIRSTVKVERLGMKVREGRLRWYGHVMRRDQEYVGRKMMEMELPGKRRRGRPKRRFLDVVKEDMKEVDVKKMDIEDRKMWRMMICCGHP